jgi:hypothetical protein
MFTLTAKQQAGLITVFRQIVKLNGGIEYDLLALFRSPADAVDFIRGEVGFRSGNVRGILVGGVFFTVNLSADWDKLYDFLADIVDTTLSNEGRLIDWVGEGELVGDSVTLPH